MEYFSVQGSRPEEGKSLFELAMKGQWSKVVERCVEDPFLLLAGGITRTNDTLLHLAVSEDQEKAVREITNIISEQLTFISQAIVRERNDGRNTALDLAAVVGNVAMCKCIAEVDPSVIVEPNEKGETPLSLAVLFGKKQAFLCLTQMLIQDPDQFSETKKMKYGTLDNTILHYAISGEHYDLALLIIKLYGKQCNVANKEGTTPLHLLADKPSDFRSGSLLVHGLCKTIIYHCILVDEHDVEQNDDRPTNWNPKFPENYRACVDFFQLFLNLVSFVLQLGVAIRNKVRERDEERPERQPVHPELRARKILYKILKLANRTMVIVLIALGIPTIRKIYDEKRQHALSILIMKELLSGSFDEVYEYYYSRKKPKDPSDTVHLPGPDETTSPYDDLDSEDGNIKGNPVKD